jgi:hypothetical protein
MLSKRTLEIEMPHECWQRIDRLVDACNLAGGLEDFVTSLLDHVQQGVYRAGAWEREWLEQCVGAEAVRLAYEQETDPL